MNGYKNTANEITKQRRTFRRVNRPAVLGDRFLERSQVWYGLSGRWRTPVTILIFRFIRRYCSADPKRRSVVGIIALFATTIGYPC